jgi:hypothetical protein
VSSRLALGAILVGAGIAWLLAAADVVELSYRAAVALLLLAIGLGIVLARGRSGVLVVLGLLVVLAAVPVFLVDDDVWSGGVGDATERPSARVELEPFVHAIGKLTVDLRSPALDLDGAVVEASVGIGELVVLVPEDVDVTLDAHVGVGNAEALGRTESGIDVDLRGISSTSGAEELDLVIEVGIGDVRVQQR